MLLTITLSDPNALNITFGIITTMAFVFAVITYYRSKKVKKPYYEMSSFNLINSDKLLNDLKEIEIKYKGCSVQNLTATKFWFGNEGKETIDKNDIPENAPLKIKAKDFRTSIISAEIIPFRKNEAANHFNCELKKAEFLECDEIIITFEYIDYNQFSIVQIIHSGKSDEDLEVSGIVKGAGEFKCKNEIPVKKVNAWGWILLFISIIVIAISYAYLKNRIWLSIVVGLMAVLFVMSISTILQKHKKEYIKL